MLIPWGTDAPIYHWPIATGSIIVINILAFVGESSGVVGEEWTLALGSGLHPLQWVTHNFLHIGPGHLIGNMIFLWAFGMIVEGKLGFFRFLLLYLGIGLAHGALVQSLMLGAKEGHALGASAEVYGLMTLCLVWAPKNEITCHVILSSFYRIFVFTWELSIVALSLFYVGMEVLWLVLARMTGLSFVSSLGHLSGAIWGFLLGTLMVKQNWVDCEGWDMYSLMAKRKRLGQEWKKRGERLAREKAGRKTRRKRDSSQGEAVSISTEEKAAAAVNKVRELVEMGDFDSALAAFDKSARTLPGWPSEPELLSLIKAMHAQRAFAASVSWMSVYCRRFPERAQRMRLKLAQVLLRDRQRPAHALRVLSEIPEGALPEDLEPIRRQLLRQANQMVEDGVLELEEDY